ncbi:MAG: non-hydrolyzing UDP-N-acetylglucosamine 2-epimerase [Solirubrobacterales bacterium]
MRILYVLGTRPNMVKMAPVIAALRTRVPDAHHSLVHMGQHYDELMSGVFLEELDLPEPDHTLGIGSGTHAQQTTRALERLPAVLAEERPDLILVPGDVNSSVGAALAASAAGIPIGHVESGLRSFDRSMPEEVNRIVIDELSELLFHHSEEAAVNLRGAGVDEARVRFVGNTMIDTLVALEDRFRKRGTAARLGIEPGGYLLVTLHRPALVDGPLLEETVARLADVGSQIPVVFPVHPRTRARMEAEGIDGGGIEMIKPVGYLDFLSLEADAAAVLTDSGGIQEETTYLGVPCFTLRANTERPVTVRAGTNTLLGLDPGRIAEIPELISGGAKTPGEPPPLWDGCAAERLAADVEEFLAGG